jgi:membrane dipeptidase|tara:strand:+ start:843 stop:2066 length:1224 start_codon:yes stop_codon:yes gene_type:complete
MSYRNKQSLSQDEAFKLHHEALVIDSQIPTITIGGLYTDNMRKKMDECFKEGFTKAETSSILSSMIPSEIQNSSDSKAQYIELWEKSGVNVASGTYAGPAAGVEAAYQSSVTSMSNAISIINSIPEKLMLVTKSDHIKEAHETGKGGIIFDFQDTLSFGTDLDKVDFFYNLGLRVVQLTYNLRNLVGDGCTEYHKSGLSYFGRELVGKLNDKKMIVDVSHCSEQVGWDSMEISSTPVVVTHSTSAAIVQHDRGKSDKFAKAIADNGGFFGVVVIPGFIQETPTATLDDWAVHIENLVNVMGIDHVCIGTDKLGPGPGTETLFEFPKEMPGLKPGHFNWSGFREEHRVNDNGLGLPYPQYDDYKTVGYEQFTDWPNLTLKLAERGFNEEELRKILGLNYLRVFEDIVG